MGEFSKWLLHKDQNDLFEILFAVTLNIVFLALIALLLWALGRPMLAFTLAKGYVVLWSGLYLASGSVNLIHRRFKVNIYDHPDAFVLSNLAVSCLLQAGWSIFAAINIHDVLAGAPVWMVVILYLVGVLSCLTAFIAVSSFYQGHIYKFISLPLALVTFLVFSVWPSAGRMIFGSFFGGL